MNSSNKHKANKILSSPYFAIAVLAFILLMSAWFLYRDYKKLLREISPNYALHPRQMLRHYSLNKNQNLDIQPWMTFEFINKIENLQPEYLKTALAITEKQYPRLSIKQLAKNRHINSADLIQQINQILKTNSAGQTKATSTPIN